MTIGPHHELVIRLTDDAQVDVTISCPHNTAERPCAVWRNNEPFESCICTCEACVDGEHADCDSDSIEDIGRKWCDARPLDECWYHHAVVEFGYWRDMLDFGHEGVQARIPVKLHGGCWEEPIDVEAIAQPRRELELETQIDRLLRWKIEATEVITRWDAIANDVPIRLGDRRSDAVAAELKRLRAEVEQLRAERDDHKARLAIEAFTAPDTDLDLMMDSLQARLRDMQAEVDG